MVAVRGAAPVAAPDGCAALPVRWSTGTGVDVIGPRAALAPIAPHGLTAEDYERARIESGVPRLGPDLDDSTIPQEAGLDRDSVSFTKGCFLGQELVARIDSRGHVNRHLQRIRPRDASLTLEPGAEVEVAGKVVGAVTSSVPGLALGYVRHEVVPPAAATAGGVPVVVEPLPERS
jgi:folate-binding protein YgfZ